MTTDQIVIASGFQKPGETARGMKIAQNREERARIGGGKMRTLVCLAVVLLCLLPYNQSFAETGRQGSLNLATKGKSDFVIVYDSTDRMMKIRVQKFVEQISSQYGINIKNKNAARVNEPYEHEMVIGNVRPCAADAVSSLSSEHDFSIMTQAGHLICYAETNQAWDYLFEYLLHDIYGTITNGNVVIPQEYRFV